MFYEMLRQLQEAGLRILGQDLERPWGGFYLIDERDTNQFISKYFYDVPYLMNCPYRMSPKILMVRPHSRLSWQYHYRRAEHWKVIGKHSVGVVTSSDDYEREYRVLDPGERLMISVKERHRLLGLEEWGIVAEIWEHIDLENPSDERDIVRVSDDFGR